MEQQLGGADRANPKKDGETVTFEEAITRTGFGKFNYVLMLGCAMGQFGVVFQLYVTSYLLPSVQCDFKINAQEKGLLTSISYIGVMLGSYLWGLLADTRGRKTVLVATLLLDAVCGVISSFAPSFYVFLALRFLNGFFICCPGAVIFPYVGEFFNSRNRAPAIMAVSIYLPLGLLVLPGVAWLVIPQPWSLALPWGDYGSWRMLVAVSSLPSALGCLLTAAVLPESPKYLMARGEEGSTLRVLRRMFAMNTGRDPADYQVQHIIPDDDSTESISKKSLMQQVKNMWFEQTLPLFKMPHIKRSLLFFVYEFGVFGCFNSLALWAPDIFNNMASFSLANGRPGTVCEAMAAVTFGPDEQRGNQTMEMFAQNSSDAPNVWFYNVSSRVIDSSAENAFQRNFSEAGLMDTETCEVTINPETFVNSLIISTAMVFMTIGLGVALRWIKQKPIMLTFLSIAFVSSLTINSVRNDTAVLGLVCLFFCFCATSGSVMLSAAVDLFPTNLRGMAVCLGMMMARAGVVVGSQVIAALVENNCSVVFYCQAGMILGCAILAFLLPDKNRK
ncbi:uncharacterized protein LOC134533129 [Bacillus rossius redtenbacheri]|uniref:uncharacterized protein LOC134533129 n=1 Tax=Bacillus rossius redtenbacheri TaxID=93214 RepID=UPI002FDE1DFA